MAILYTPHGGDAALKPIQFGGGTSGTLYGQPGPFPKYSISREIIRTGDGTPMASKFSISITGTATIHEDDTQDITDKGARQSRVQGQAINNLQMGRAEEYLWGVGKLSIDPYGGKANKISFTDAMLVSVECQEQTEESAGIQTLEYSMSFEAYQDASAASNNTTKLDAKTDPIYCMSSMEESWEVSENEGVTTFVANDISQSPYKTYTLTHTVSGTGHKKFTSGGGGGLDTDGDAWRQAVLWVKSRLVDNPLLAVSTNIVGSTSHKSASFNPKYMSSADDIGYDFSDYKAFNSVRTSNSSYGEGTYSVTTTWLLSESATYATHDVEVSIEASQDAQSNKVTVNGTITGLSLNAPGNSTKTDDKYTNATAITSTVLAAAYTLANQVYVANGYTGSLRNIELSKSIGQNKVAGTISYSVSFDDLAVTLENALSETITINYDNEDGTNNVIAVIPIIGKTDGPVIQNMGTTTEKKVNVSFDVVMQKGYRTTKPNGLSSVIAYKPTTSNPAGVHQGRKTESWSPSTGAYNLSLEWIYV